MNPTRNNVRTNLVGDGNTYKVSNTTGGNFQVSESSMSIRNCTLIRLNGNQHHVHLGNCSNVVVDGAGNALSLNNTINGSVNGERNTVYLNNLSNFDLIGHDNVCELKDETSLQSSHISGNENRVLGSANANFAVCGNENFVDAQNNTNVRIQASQSKIVARYSSHITVNGAQNVIALWEAKFKHRLMRDLTGSANLVSITTNRIEAPFQGLGLGLQGHNVGVGDLNNIANILGAAVAQAMQNPNVEQWHCQGQLYTPKQASATTIFGFGSTGSSFLSPTTRYVPQLDISYIGQMSITRKDYVLGIFHFTLEHLKKDTEQDYTSFLGIQVHSSELDENSFTSARMPGEMEDRIILTGRKNGILQTIGLGGPQVMSCENGSQFIVNLNPSAAVQDEAGN